MHRRPAWPLRRTRGRNRLGQTSVSGGECAAPSRGCGGVDGRGFTRAWGSTAFSRPVPASRSALRAVGLGHAARGFLADRLGSYDWYGFLEDDLRLHDPWFFTKLAWFISEAGDNKVLLPNRFEMSVAWRTRKVYADGPLSPQQSGPWSNDRGPKTLTGRVLGRTISFRRASNPHAGCWFLTQAQMKRFAAAAHFMDKQSTFIGPLESAATLSLLRSFPIYKPALDCADFLEIEHQDDRFMRVAAGLRPHRPASRPAREGVTL